MNDIPDTELRDRELARIEREWIDTARHGPRPDPDTVECLGCGDYVAAAFAHVVHEPDEGRQTGFCSPACVTRALQEAEEDARQDAEREQRYDGGRYR